MKKTNLTKTFVAEKLRLCTGIPIRDIEVLLKPRSSFIIWRDRIKNKTIEAIRSLCSVRELSEEHMQKYEGYVKVNYVPKEYPQLQTYR
jgi:hypothetical protein